MGTRVWWQEGIFQHCNASVFNRKGVQLSQLVIEKDTLSEALKQGSCCALALGLVV